MNDRLSALSYRILLFYFIFAAVVHLVQFYDAAFLPAWFRLFGFQLFLLATLIWLYRNSWRPRLELSLKAAGLSILALASYFGALSALNIACEHFFSPTREPVFQGSTTSVFVLQIFAAPVLEELFFRDYLLRSFFIGMGKWWQALLFSSAFFMLAHFSLYPGALILGLISGVLFLSFRSILPCIGFHLISNLSWYFLPTLFPALFQTLAEKNWLFLFFR